MAQRLFLELFLRGGIRLVLSTCLCTMMFILLLMANDQTSFDKFIAQHKTCCEGNRILLTMLSRIAKKKPSDEKVGQKVLSAVDNISAEIKGASNNNLRDKYSKWIPHPQQEIASLYVIKNSDVCREAHNMDFVILVHSAAGNFNRRQGIRNTWGNISRLRQDSMNIMFLLGLTKSNDMQMKIIEENGKYHDIVQGNFIDTYQNLTHKAVLGLRWVKEFCNNSKRVIKIDDDVFIDTVKLFSEFDSMFKNSQPDSINCYRQKANTSQIQRKSGKWKVDKGEFRNHTYFPLTYCHGFFIIMSTNIALELYKTAYKVPFFWIDDFYVYGMLTEKAGINKNINDVRDLLSLHTYNSLNCFGNTDQKCNLLVGNAPSQEFMQSMWDKMLIQNKNISR